MIRVYQGQALRLLLSILSLVSKMLVDNVFGKSATTYQGILVISVRMLNMVRCWISLTLQWEAVRPLAITISATYCPRILVRHKAGWALVYNLERTEGYFLLRSGPFSVILFWIVEWQWNQGWSGNNLEVFCNNAWTSYFRYSVLVAREAVMCFVQPV